MSKDKKGGLGALLGIVVAAAVVYGSWKIVKAVDRLLEKDLRPEDYKDKKN